MRRWMEPAVLWTLVLGLAGVLGLFPGPVTHVAAAGAPADALADAPAGASREAAVGAAAVGGSVTAQADVSFASMVERMADLEWLAQVPVPGERGAQASSYDRATRVVNGLKVEWFANGDAGHFVDTRIINGREEAVLAEIDGPGAIVRIWSANPQGVLRIYLDRSSQPAVEVPFAAAVRGDRELPFAEPFAGTRSRGGNIYFPFTFQEHALVTVQYPGQMYYHVNYVTFPAGTTVETYEPGLLDAHQDLIRDVAARLADPYGADAGGVSRNGAGSGAADALTTAISWQLGPGESGVIDLTGPAAITELTLRVSAPELDRALRQVLLAATWDGREQPSIWSPVGDFFGGTPGLRPYQSLPLGILPDGLMYSRWYMPFGEEATIALINEGDQVVTLEGSLTYRPIEWRDDLAYFHAKWRQQRHLSNLWDWPVLDAGGPGRFVGLTLSVMNPVRQWWGEGDEKIYVDGEAFPSTFGTGTEDYFGYAWSSTEIFSHAYHSQPRADGPDNFGHIINTRFHVLDNIPFQERIRFDLEIWHWVGDARPTYSAVAYWYSQSDRDGFAAIPVERRGIDEPPAWRIFEVDGAIEGESLRVLRVTRGVADPQDMGFFTTPERLWSRDRHLWWRGGGTGDKLYLSVPVPESGRYRVIGAFTKARDYGVVQLSLGDVTLGEPLDFYHPEVVPTGELELGEVSLQGGNAVLTVEIVGTNRLSVGHMFGLDYLRLIPVP